MRLIPGYSLGKENWKAVICLFGAWGRHVPHVYEIPRKLAKSRSYSKAEKCLKPISLFVYIVKLPIKSRKRQ